MCHHSVTTMVCHHTVLPYNVSPRRGVIILHFISEPKDTRTATYKHRPNTDVMNGKQLCRNLHLWLNFAIKFGTLCLTYVLVNVEPFCHIKTIRKPFPQKGPQNGDFILNIDSDTHWGGNYFNSISHVSSTVPLHYQILSIYTQYKA